MSEYDIHDVRYQYSGCSCSYGAYVEGEVYPKPDCDYHNVAKAQPLNHRIPWNCPTFYDGCNCRDTITNYRLKDSKNRDELFEEYVEYKSRFHEAEYQIDDLHEALDDLLAENEALKTRLEDFEFRKDQPI